jgi:hypothetical protein
LHSDQFFSIRSRGEKLSNLTGGAVYQKYGRFLVAKMGFEVLVLEFNACQPQRLIQLRGRTATAKPVFRLTVDHVARTFSLNPLDGVPFAGFDRNGAFLLVMLHYEVRVCVACKDFKSDGDRAFSDIVWTDQNRKAVGQFKLRLGMSHKIGKNNFAYHRNRVITMWKTALISKTVRIVTIVPKAPNEPSKYQQ